MVKPEDIRDFAGDIYQEARRLIALVEDILRLSQLDEGAESLEREPVELLALSQEVARRAGTGGPERRGLSRSLGRAGPGAGRSAGCWTK